MVLPELAFPFLLTQFIVSRGDFFCRQERDGAKDTPWTSVPRFAVCTRVIV